MCVPGCYTHTSVRLRISQNDKGDLQYIAVSMPVWFLLIVPSDHFLLVICGGEPCLRT